MRTLVLSDVHLSTLSPTGPPHRRPGAAARTDRALSRVVDEASLRAHAERVPLEVVLAGDVLDVDAPPVDPSEPDLRARRCDAGAAAVVDRILRHHPSVVESLRRAALRGGQRVVILPGNHDSQLNLPAVRDVVRAALAPPGWPSSIVFRSWVHMTPDRVLVEHGHQYDPFCRLTTLLPYLTREPRAQRAMTGERSELTPRSRGSALVIQDSVGRALTHHAPSLSADVDPYAVDPIANVSISTILASSAPGDLLPMAEELLTASRPVPGDLSHRDVLRAAEETGLLPAMLLRHQGLAAERACGDLLARAALGTYAYGPDADARLRDAMRRSAELHRARVVVSGHTHAPFVETDRWGRTLANSGSWTGGLDGLVGTFLTIDTGGGRDVVRLWRAYTDGSIR